MRVLLGAIFLFTGFSFVHTDDVIIGALSESKPLYVTIAGILESHKGSEFSFFKIEGDDQGQGVFIEPGEGYIIPLAGCADTDTYLLIRWSLSERYHESIGVLRIPIDNLISLNQKVRGRGRILTLVFKDHECRPVGILRDRIQQRPVPLVRRCISEVSPFPAMLPADDDSDLRVLFPSGDPAYS